MFAFVYIGGGDEAEMIDGIVHVFRIEQGPKKALISPSPLSLSTSTCFTNKTVSSPLPHNAITQAMIYPLTTHTHTQTNAHLPSTHSTTLSTSIPPSNPLPSSPYAREVFAAAAPAPAPAAGPFLLLTG